MCVCAHNDTTPANNHTAAEPSTVLKDVPPTPNRIYLHFPKSHRGRNKINNYSVTSRDTFQHTYVSLSGQEQSQHASENIAATGLGGGGRRAGKKRLSGD
jgi:hypothetical protein